MPLQPTVFQHHTTGINCERCIPGYYRSPDHPIDSPYVCYRECDLLCSDLLLAWVTLGRAGLGGFAAVGSLRLAQCHLSLSAGCNCESDFTDGTCEDLTGRCYCKPNYTGEHCQACAEGYLNFPHCYRECRAQLGAHTPSSSGEGQQPQFWLLGCAFPMPRGTPVPGGVPLLVWVGAAPELSCSEHRVNSSFPFGWSFISHFLMKDRLKRAVMVCCLVGHLCFVPCFTFLFSLFSFGTVKSLVFHQDFSECVC